MFRVGLRVGDANDRVARPSAEAGIGYEMSFLWGGSLEGILFDLREFVWFGLGWVIGFCRHCYHTVVY